MARLRSSRKRNKQGIAVKISKDLKNDLDKIRKEFLDEFGFSISYAEASDQYRKQKRGNFF